MQRFEENSSWRRASIEKQTESLIVSENLEIIIEPNW
jgi:hypothetical protein